MFSASFPQVLSTLENQVLRPGSSYYRHKRKIMIMLLTKMAKCDTMKVV